MLRGTVLFCARNVSRSLVLGIARHRMFSVSEEEEVVVVQLVETVVSLEVAVWEGHATKARQSREVRCYVYCDSHLWHILAK